MPHVFDRSQPRPPTDNIRSAAARALGEARIAAYRLAFDLAAFAQKEGAPPETLALARALSAWAARPPRA